MGVKWTEIFAIKNDTTRRHGRGKFGFNFEAHHFDGVVMSGPKTEKEEKSKQNFSAGSRTAALGALGYFYLLTIATSTDLICVHPYVDHVGRTG